jgi:exodeoxyribonuclease-3
MTINVDGLEAACGKGFFQLPHVEAADVLCLQDTRCKETVEIGTSLGYRVAAANPLHYEASGRRAHGGVAIFSRLPICNITGPENERSLFENGQYVSCSVGALRIASVYVKPPAPLESLRAFDRLFTAMEADYPLALICGDFNTMRDARDSWRFYDAVRAQDAGTDAYMRDWFKGLFSQGWHDVVARDLNVLPFYTWWETAKHRRLNKGIRLDYQLASAQLAARVESGTGTPHNDDRRGRHAQLSITYDLPAISSLAFATPALAAV